MCVNQSEYSFSFLFGFSSIDFIIGIFELSFGYQFATSFFFSVYARNLFSLVITELQWYLGFLCATLQHEYAE